MTDFLVRHFVKDHERTGDAAVRTAYGNLAEIVCILCNLLLAGGKMAAGFLFGSISITADGLNNLSDASSNVVSLMGFRLASRPADEEHPYGHGRYEYLAGLVVAAMILLIGVELAKSSLEKILHPTPVEFSLLSVAVLVASILVKLWMSAFNRRLGKLIHSGTLEATAADSRNDVISTAAVLIALVLGKVTGLELDGWMGMGVALFILYSGFGLMRETIDPLLGSAPDPELVHHIRQKILSYSGVLGVHDLMIHDYGPGRQFASLHVEMAAEADVLESHELIDTIERDFRAERLEVLIHFDPVVTQDEQVNQARSKLTQIVQERWGDRVSIHDLRMVPGKERINLIFDCVTPYGFEEDDKQVCGAIRQAVADWDKRYVCIIRPEKEMAPETAK